MNKTKKLRSSPDPYSQDNGVNKKSLFYLSKGESLM